MPETPSVSTVSTADDLDEFLNFNLEIPAEEAELNNPV